MNATERDWRTGDEDDAFAITWPDSDIRMVAPAKCLRRYEALYGPHDAGAVIVRGTAEDGAFVRRWFRTAKGPIEVVAP